MVRIFVQPFTNGLTLMETMVSLKRATDSIDTGKRSLVTRVKRQFVLACCDQGMGISITLFYES
jgi:hypothetical protein